MSPIFRRGTKTFSVTARGDDVQFRCHCEVYPGAEILVSMSMAQAQALIDRRPAGDVLAGRPFEVIELFRSGLTPAEFDQTYGGKAKPLAEYPLYDRRGGDGVATPVTPAALAGIDSMF